MSDVNLWLVLGAPSVLVLLWVAAVAAVELDERAKRRARESVRINERLERYCGLDDELYPDETAVEPDSFTRLP